MVFIKRYLNEMLLSLGLLGAYLATRLYNIMSLPMFTDEAIYTRWAQIARYDASWRFISLTDGKQPSFVWLDMIIMRFVNDPLLAGRLLSVLAGIVALVGIYFLASEIFKNKRIGYIAAVIYIIYPFSLVYDRMALYESLVSAVTIWALYLEILLIRLRRLDVALILGMVAGFGVLTKSSAFFAIYLLPFSILLFNFKQKNWKQELLKWAALAGLSAIMAYGFYSILRLSPFFHIIAEKTTIFVYPLRDWLSHPFEFFVGNLNGITDWFIAYTTIPTFILILISFFLGDKKVLREKLFLFSWFIIPFVLLALFGRVLYPRFILFMIMPLLVLVAFSLNFILDSVKTKLLKAGVFLAFVIFMLRSDFFILTDFANASISRSDTDQFMNEWPAGGGISEVISILSTYAKTQKIYVASGGTFGSLPTYAMEIYLDENKNIEKRGIFPVPEDIPKDLLERAKTMPVYVFMSNQKEFENNLKSWPIKLIVEYKKGEGDAYTRLYEVIPSN
ncbi:MAG: hypothetical protein A3C30_00820 [Candidatus Levybacteria bacterium RIFCSPHIGHO2_02_FULL_40_18]|nr:MAG: hypothetical protein A2869_03110 [Candidatus Levybacteria bacterium RIFCSPHIGHO2_01_FULL_40_58]OGH27242.1 MAG: hypothetical protein A3C30_00820 [Candidatus Levybacteria bacterium RIFCSPHIGHO2_02_FULL_40_18]OGH31101.1 MAG: hypothetical protein A3E43_05235 [Candidatus Levybacteria bacterium RIFCSPHIGHO2_12_FULL_40_31]OGH40731.1 MAG: hypothetical protein A2894_03205 [Candidatus Levybacteria bacterium RIFCSPLOWO2_01_FULL_40_64]OGH49370.1 MAG: hypothetical protein A3I54_01845 [Candidatus Lev